MQIQFWNLSSGKVSEFLQELIMQNALQDSFFHRINLCVCWSCCRGANTDGEREADYHTLAYKKIPFTEQTNSWKANSSQVSADLVKVNSREQLIQPVIFLLRWYVNSEVNHYGLCVGNQLLAKKRSPCDCQIAEWPLEMELPNF